MVRWTLKDVDKKIKSLTTLDLFLGVDVALEEVKRRYLNGYYDDKYFTLEEAVYNIMED